MSLDAIDGWTLRATADAEADKGPFARMLGAPRTAMPGPAGQEPPPTEPVRVHLDLYTRQQPRHIGRLGRTRGYPGRRVALSAGRQLCRHA